MNSLTPYINSPEVLRQFSDEDLVGKLLIEKNALIFEVMYDRYEEEVFNKCLNFLKSRALAFQSAKRIFVEMYQNIHAAAGHRFSSWLYYLTYNTCVTVLSEKKQIEKQKNIDRAVYDKHIRIEVGDAILFQMKEDRLSKAIDRIDPKDKAILLLRYQDDVSEKEMESLLKVDSEEIKVRLRKAKARIIETYYEF